MARFDVYRQHGSENLLLDCQADVLHHLDTCITVPLFPLAKAPSPSVSRLNPSFTIHGDHHVMMTQYSAAIRRGDLGEQVAHLGEEQATIMNALDMLLTGY